MKPPIDSLFLFPVLNEKLISFLKGLSIADWQRQTVARQWVVKDVAAHLLDGNFRRIALHRDKWSPAPEAPIQSYADLVAYLNGLNADWVRATKRLSPAILIDLLQTTNEEVYSLFAKLDPFANAIYPVGWAGENDSTNWFDIAREYTERWLHQQQIRDAMGDNGVMTKELYQPLLHIFLQAWPFIMRQTVVSEGSMLKLVVTGEGGGSWLLRREGREWRLENGEGKAENGEKEMGEGSGRLLAETILDGAAAWKLFSKSIRKEDCREAFEIKGDRELGEKVLDMVSVMA